MFLLRGWAVLLRRHYVNCMPVQFITPVVLGVHWNVRLSRDGELLCFYETWSSITVCTEIRSCTLFSVSWIRSCTLFSVSWIRSCTLFSVSWIRSCTLFSVSWIRSCTLFCQLNPFLYSVLYHLNPFLYSVLCQLNPANSRIPCDPKINLSIVCHVLSRLLGSCLRMRLSDCNFLSVSACASYVCLRSFVLCNVDWHDELWEDVFLVCCIICYFS